MRFADQRAIAWSDAPPYTHDAYTDFDGEMLDTVTADATIYSGRNAVTRM